MGLMNESMVGCDVRVIGWEMMKSICIMHGEKR